MTAHHNKLLNFFFPLLNSHFNHQYKSVLPVFYYSQQSVFFDFPVERPQRYAQARCGLCHIVKILL